MTGRSSAPIPGATTPSGQTLRVAGSVVRGDFMLHAELEVSPGHIVAVLGPNAAGKSTLLHAVAGLVGLTSGSIRLGDRILDDPAGDILVPPHDRPVTVVFQEYRLFPHLSVRDNVAFAPRANGLSKSAADRVAARILGEFELSELADRRPATLSGGQAQRVALARAAAAEPAVVLLDEPLSSLDLPARVTLRDRMSRDLRRLPGATLLVTHDPLDALVLADHLVVLEDGIIVQEGSPRQVLARPRTEYVAGLTGVNLFRGVVQESDVVLANGHRLAGCGDSAPTSSNSSAVLVAVPPNALKLEAHPAGGRGAAGGAPSDWQGTVTDLHQLSDRILVVVDSDPPVRAEFPTLTFADLALRPGDRVSISLPETSKVAVFEEDAHDSAHP